MTGDFIEAIIKNPLGQEDGYYLVGFRTQTTLAKFFQLTGPCSLGARECKCIYRDCINVLVAPKALVSQRGCCASFSEEAVLNVFRRAAVRVSGQCSATLFKQFWFLALTESGPTLPVNSRSLRNRADPN